MAFSGQILLWGAPLPSPPGRLVQFGSGGSRWWLQLGRRGGDPLQMMDLISTFTKPIVSFVTYDNNIMQLSRTTKGHNGVASPSSHNLDIPSSSLVLFYDNKRVYPGSSPDLLKMWEKAKLTICEHRTVRYLQHSRGEQAPGAAPETIQRRSPSVQSETDENVEKMKLIIRSSSIELPFRVRASTTCGELVAKFLTKAGIPIPSDNKRPTLLLTTTELRTY